MENYQLEKLNRELMLAMHMATIEQDKRASLTDYLIHVFKSGCPRKIKDEAILSMFSPGFKDKIMYGAQERMVFEILRRDGDLFKMIESLLETIDNQQKTLTDIMQHQLPY
jgi:hypothetical protein